MLIGDILSQSDAKNCETLSDIKKYAYTLEFRRKLDHALDVLDTFLNRAKNPIISCGGGKDGTAVALLAQMLGACVPIICANPPNPLPDREIHKKVLKQWLGQKWIDVGYPWNVDGVLSGVERYPAGLKMNILSKYQHEHGIDGVIFGIRAAESKARKMNLAIHGEIYKTKDGDRCQPIAKWDAKDSLCIAMMMDAPINSVYIKMDGIGNMEQLHDGTWWPHGTEDRTNWFRRYYPDYYELYEAARKIGDGKDYVCRY